MKRLALLLLLACPVFAANDADVIRKHILKGAEAFMKGDPEGILAHYGKDIVLSYPGVPDMHYDDLVKARERSADGPGQSALPPVAVYHAAPWLRLRGGGSLFTRRSSSVSSSAPPSAAR